MTRILVSAAMAMLLAVGIARASEVETYTVDGIAIGGSDPVAYFTDGKPVQGSAEFALEHEGDIWHFANAANRDAFAANPEKYKPAYGGYCAYGLLYREKVETDPDAWKIVDGKLYLNFSPDINDTWQKNLRANIEKSDAIWPEVKDTPADEL